MITRIAEKELSRLARQFKAVALTGPRQSGKTTLARFLFKDKAYVSLENPENRQFALEDPKGFLQTYNQGVILDEIQKVPELFSYLQQILDEERTAGKYLLTGSNNFLLQENITQSLAGRIAYLVLLPFSYPEINSLTGKNTDLLLFQGGYPPIYDQPVDPVKWLVNYFNTYVERDVRQLKNINNLKLFERFIRLCAGRTGQLLNMNSLAVETGVDNKTIASWLGILESSYIVFTLKPHFKNFNKRIVKTPKLYFYDSGLVSSLLGIKNPEQISMHPMRGPLFENLVISEFIKHKNNHGKAFELYFWRDNTGHEIDLLVDNGTTLEAIEIKSGKTVTSDYFKNLMFWEKLSGNKRGNIIYNGNEFQHRSDDKHVIPWYRMFEHFKEC